VLLNNDVLVSTGWLEGLVAQVESRDRVGLVGPMSNYAPPPQLVEGVSYQNVEEFERFARAWALEHRGESALVERLTGFCLLLSRAALAAVGLLDERFEGGFFEDDDLCLRVRARGFLLVLARHVFVHHAGSQTFRALGIDTQSLLEENFGKFRAKWGEVADAWKAPKKDESPP
jgi:GT2 family glycosyltransferase